MINWMMNLLKPIIKWIGEKRLPFTKKLITGIHYYEARNLIEPGDVILTTTYGELSNLINRGMFKHTVMYIGGGQIKECIHAIGKGVCKIDLVTLLLKCDLFIVLKPKFTTDIDKLKAVQEIQTHIGEAYDYFFLIDNQGAKYCSELVYNAYKSVIPGLKLKKEIIAGRIVVTPDNFYKDEKNWNVAYDSRNRKAA